MVIKNVKCYCLSRQLLKMQRNTLNKKKSPLSFWFGTFLLVGVAIASFRIEAEQSHAKAPALSIPEPEVLEAATDETREFPLLMRTRRNAPVRRGMFKHSAISALIYKDAIIRVRRRSATETCKRGWMERIGSGFICAKHLKKTDELAARPAPLDNVRLIDGFGAYKVTGQRPRLYRSTKDIDRHRPMVRLRNGSVLVIADKLMRHGQPYLKTRRGWYVEAEGLAELPPRIDTLAVDIGDQTDMPGGIVVGRSARVFSGPSDAGPSVGAPERWSVISRANGGRLIAENGWVSLGNGQYIHDDAVARVRQAPVPPRLGEKERWIAVDVGEQLMHAYEGEQLLKIIPCSTGRKGNTVPGSYRIQWKRRAQTMQLRMGEVRVEDVQWVMYYHRQESIAIHSAFWHDDFGTPVSHGCVNLPIRDARWLFEWSTPFVHTEDSERFPIPGDPGSRVIVFNSAE